MSWDGLYTYQRVYHEFEVGDEVYTVKKFGALTKRKGYIVLKCHNPYSHLPDSNVRVITLLNDIGVEPTYGSYRFKKTERQIREDKIKTILGCNQETL